MLCLSLSPVLVDGVTRAWSENQNSVWTEIKEIKQTCDLPCPLVVGGDAESSVPGPAAAERCCSRLHPQPGLCGRVEMGGVYSTDTLELTVSGKQQSRGCRFMFLFSLKERFSFLHIKPYNKDIYHHIWCSTALLWQLAQFWELELVADATASWKQQRSMCTQTVCQKIQ